MNADLADLERLRQQLAQLIGLIQDSRTPSGVRKRATKALCHVSLQAIDTAAALLKAQQAAPVVQELDLV